MPFKFLCESNLHESSCNIRWLVICVRDYKIKYFTIPNNCHDMYCIQKKLNKTIIT